MTRACGVGRDELSGVGHDVIWSGDWAEDPGDAEILAYAHREGCVLIMLDKDFGELVFRRGQPHSGIVRLVGYRATEQGRVAAEVLSRYAEELTGGTVITASPTGVRIRPGKETP